MLDDNDIKRIREMIAKSMDFSTKKRGDTPTDGYHLTPQKYVDMYGSVAGRPIGSIANIGQSYFNTTTNTPITFTPQGTWVNGVGSVVLLN